MVVTDIRMKLNENKNDPKLKAIATITLDNKLAIHGIKVIDNGTRLLLSMPYKQVGIEQKSYVDIVHPITTEFRNELEEVIIDRYNQIIADTEAGE